MKTYMLRINACSNLFILLLLVGQLNASVRSKMLSLMHFIPLNGSVLLLSLLRRLTRGCVNKNQVYLGTDLFGIGLVFPNTGSPWGQLFLIDLRSELDCSELVLVTRGVHRYKTGPDWNRLDRWTRIFKIHEPRTGPDPGR